MDLATKPVRVGLLVSAWLMCYPSVAQPSNPQVFEIFPLGSYLSSAGDSFSALVVNTSTGSIFGCTGIANFTSPRLDCNKVAPTKGSNLPPGQHVVVSQPSPPTFSGGPNGIWAVDQGNGIIRFCFTSGTAEEFASRYACISRQLPSS
jgi:hypothetical protein